ncbi:hypothetical protein GWN28_03540 [candidate division KSB1 bacterium]|nr:hypothetical protein [candidate division KSB1 bacterium]NIU89857.1 hypothetical protein [candidate division KSB1 bacterium]NIW17471.1 hypothetical protein [candidate division KSB1 bacterium]
MLKRIIFISLLSAAFLFGCGDGGNDTASSPKPTASKKRQKKTTPAPIPVEEKDAPAETAYTYNPVGKRDPFDSLLDIKRPVAPEQTEPLTPLQKFGLQQLRLLGAVVGLEEPKAMVIAPDGKSYILRVGTKVGKNNGTVIDINPEAVLIEEVYYDFSGSVKKNIKKLKLPEREGVK